MPFIKNTTWLRPFKVSKAVPLHAMETLGGRGGIAPTHSRPRHWVGVSGQRHAPAALLPPGKGPPVPIVQNTRYWTVLIQDRHINRPFKVIRVMRGYNYFYTNSITHIFKTFFSEQRDIFWTSTVMVSFSNKLFTCRNACICLYRAEC
jgi:hypothetical protein